MFKCLRRNCTEQVSGFWCEEHRPEWAPRTPEECEHPAWIQGHVLIEAVSEGLYESLGEPPLGCFWKICERCGDKRAVPFTSLLKRTNRLGRSAA